MTFLNPMALWGVLLLVIPVIVHLFNFRKHKKVYFSNLTFLKEVKKDNKSTSTIKKVLVLTSRLLVVSFIVLAFAQPVQVEEGISKSQTILYYLDNSLSMQQVDESGDPLIFKASGTLQQILDKAMIKGSKLVTNDNVTSLDRGKDQFEGIGQFSPKNVALKDIQGKSELYGNDEIILFSDFQRNSYDLDNALNDTLKSYKFYHILPKNQNNLFVDTMFLSTNSQGGGDYVLNIDIQNVGSEDIEDALVQVNKGDRQVFANSIDIDANSIKSVHFSLEDVKDVYGNYSVNLADVPVVFDNEFYFYLSKPSKSKIVLLSNEGTSRFLDKLFDNEDYFDLHIENVSSTSLNQLLDADLLILSDLQEIPDWLISQYSELNCRVLVIPNELFDEQSYSRFTQLQIKRVSSETLQSLSPKALEHPLLSGVFANNREERVGLPSFAPIMEVNGFHENVLATNANLPALVKSGTSQLYVLTTPLDEKYTDFQKHALFVPVMYKLAQPEIQKELYHRLVDEYIRVAMDSLIKESVLRLSSVSESFIPSYHFDTKGIVLQVPEDMQQPGIYTLTNDSDTIGVFAFNYSADESNISTYSSDEMISLVSGYDHIEYYPISNKVFSSASTDLENDSKTLWKYALLLALTFILVESILLRFLK